MFEGSALSLEVAHYNAWLTRLGRTYPGTVGTQVHRNSHSRRSFSIQGAYSLRQEQLQGSSSSSSSSGYHQLLLQRRSRPYSQHCCDFFLFYCGSGPQSLCSQTKQGRPEARTLVAKASIACPTWPAVGCLAVWTSAARSTSPHRAVQGVLPPRLL